jgi:bile acid:Na+ symporter, BASS family
MSAEQLIRLAIILSIMLIVFSFALLSTWREAASLFRSPGLLLRSLLSMNVLLPLFAVALISICALRPAVAIALVAVAVSPVPPFLPRKQLKLVGHREYIFGLLGATSLLNVVLAPLTVDLLSHVYALQASIDLAAIGRIVAMTVLVPFALGLIVGRLVPGARERASSFAGKAGILLLAAAAVPVLVKMWPAMISLLGNGTLLAIVAFVGVGLAVGHLLGGPDPEDRTVLALATATRHPGVALVIASGNFPGEKLVAPALILYLIVGAIASVPYVKWRKHRHQGTLVV